MDDIDKLILKALQENGTISYRKMKEDKKLTLSPSSIHNRIKKLERNGIIKKITAIVNPKKVGYEIMAWLGLTVDPNKLSETAQKISIFKNVQLVATTSGDHDLVAMVISKDFKSLWKFINKNIKTIPEVKENMHVSTFLEIFKNRTEIEL